MVNPAERAFNIEAEEATAVRERYNSLRLEEQAARDAERARRKSKVQIHKDHSQENPVGATDLTGFEVPAVMHELPTVVGPLLVDLSLLTPPNRNMQTKQTEQNLLGMLHRKARALEWRRSTITGLMRSIVETVRHIITRNVYHDQAPVFHGTEGMAELQRVLDYNARERLATHEMRVARPWSVGEIATATAISTATASAIQAAALAAQQPHIRRRTLSVPGDQSCKRSGLSSCSYSTPTRPVVIAAPTDDSLPHGAVAAQWPKSTDWRASCKRGGCANSAPSQDMNGNADDDAGPQMTATEVARQPVLPESAITISRASPAMQGTRTISCGSPESSSIPLPQAELVRPEAVAAEQRSVAMLNHQQPSTLHRSCHLRAATALILDDLPLPSFDDAACSTSPGLTPSVRIFAFFTRGTTALRTRPHTVAAKPQVFHQIPTYDSPLAGCKYMDPTRRTLLGGLP